MLFGSGARGHRSNGTEYSRDRAYVERVTKRERKSELQTRVRRPNFNQKAVFDEIVHTWNSRRNEDRMQSNGKLSFLNGRAETGKTLLCRCYQMRGV